MANKECVLADKICIDCGECDICDLDPKKMCDNCCKCIDGKSDYKGLYIDEIIEEESAELFEEEEEDDDWKFNEDVIEEYDEK